jgi:hypothetical protein
MSTTILIGWKQQLPADLQVTYADRFDPVTGETLPQYQSFKSRFETVGVFLSPNYKLVSGAEAPLPVEPEPEPEPEPVPAEPDPAEPNPYSSLEVQDAQAELIAAQTLYETALETFLAISSPDDTDRETLAAAAERVAAAQALVSTRIILGQ